jgi:hypothetical protein
VLRSLEKVQEGDSQTYLEKIVQVSFDIPQASEINITNVLFSQLNDILSEPPDLEFNQGYWENVFYSGLSNLFETIRDVNRFVNAFRFTYSLVGKDTNPVDLIALTALQIFEPEVFLEIYKSKDALTSQSFTVKTQANKEQDKIIYDGILKKAKYIPHDKIKKLIQRLFPKTQAVYSNTSYGYEYWSEWATEGRVASPDVFDVYFKLTLSSNDFSKSELESILLTTANRADFVNRIAEIVKRGRDTRFLERFGDYAQKVPLESVASVLSVFFELGDTFSSGEQGFLIMDNSNRLGQIIRQLLERYETQDNRFRILDEIIDQEELGINLTVARIMKWGIQQGKWRDKGPDPEVEWLFSKDQLTHLEKKIIERIRVLGSQNSNLLIDGKRTTLYFWKHFAENDVKIYLDTITRDDSGLLNFIKFFETKSYHQNIGWNGLGEYAATEKKSIDIKSVSEFLDVEVIRERLSSLLNPSKALSLTEADKEVARRFIGILEKGEWENPKHFEE